MDLCGCVCLCVLVYVGEWWIYVCVCVGVQVSVNVSGKFHLTTSPKNYPTQHRYYLWSVLLACFILPTVIPWYFWGESLWTAYLVCSIFRYTAVLNFTWCVNSVAHLWGNKPYDRRINPVQNIGVTLGAAGEG